MKQSLKDFFEGTSIKKALFIIIWTIGLLGWVYFYQSYTITRAEANWSYQEAVKLKTERIEIDTKKDGDEVSTSTQVQPIEGTAELNLSARPSGRTVIATTYNAEVGQTDADPFTMASGKKVYEGAVASNCHPLGTKLEIEGKEFTVEDRMNKRYTSLCGTENERVDIFKWNRADNFKKRLAYKIL